MKMCLLTTPESGGKKPLDSRHWSILSVPRDRTGHVPRLKLCRYLLQQRKKARDLSGDAKFYLKDREPGQRSFR